MPLGTILALSTSLITASQSLFWVKDATPHATLEMPFPWKLFNSLNILMHVSHSLNINGSIASFHPHEVTFLKVSSSGLWFLNPLLGPPAHLSFPPVLPPTLGLGDRCSWRPASVIQEQDTAGDPGGGSWVLLQESRGAVPGPLDFHLHIQQKSWRAFPQNTGVQIQGTNHPSPPGYSKTSPSNDSTTTPSTCTKSYPGSQPSPSWHPPLALQTVAWGESGAVSAQGQCH